MPEGAGDMRSFMRENVMDVFYYLTTSHGQRIIDAVADQLTSKRDCSRSPEIARDCSRLAHLWRSLWSSSVNQWQVPRLCRGAPIKLVITQLIHSLAHSPPGRYRAFVAEHPGFSGGVSIFGHSHHRHLHVRDTSTTFPRHVP